jgi:hypothetical protein
MYLCVDFNAQITLETWSLTLGEERSLRVLRIIFWSKRDEVTGEWGNEELSDL